MEYQFGKYISFHIMAKPVGANCNLNCEYCYYLEKQNLYKNEKNPVMTQTILEKFIKQYIDSQNSPIITFSWQGGEPCISGLSFYKKVVELQNYYANGKQIMNTFQTNGTLLNDEWCDFFAKNNFLIGISIDGTEQLHDRYRKNKAGNSTWQQVVDSIQLLNKYDIEFNTLTTVNASNAESGVEIYRFLKSMGVQFMQFLPVVEFITDQRADKLPLQIVEPTYSDECSLAPWSVDAKKYGQFLTSIFNEWIKTDVGNVFVQLFDVCIANTLGVSSGLCVFDKECGKAPVIEHNGDLYMCDHFVFPEYLLGNIRSLSLYEMCSSPRLFNFGKEKLSTLSSQCLDCDVLYLCNGECPKHRFKKTSNGEKSLNYLCEGLKYFFSYTQPYWQYMANEIKSNRTPTSVMTGVVKNDILK